MWPSSDPGSGERCRQEAFETYPAEDVEMDLAGTDVPDDEFREEPQLEEPKVLEEGGTQCGKIGSHAHSQTSGASQQGIVVSRFSDWWSQ